MANKEFIVATNATVTVDGATGSVVRCADATKVSLYGNATLAGTTPSLTAKIQAKDANGNWHDIASATAITATGNIAKLDVSGPFPASGEFRVYSDVDVADGNEAYTNVDYSLAFQV